MIPDSPADQSGLLFMYDELLAVNNTDVSWMDHADIVGLIKSSGTSIQLTVQQPEDIDLIIRQQMVKGLIVNVNFKTVYTCTLDIFIDSTH